MPRKNLVVAKEQRKDLLNKLRLLVHEHCVVCSSTNKRGLSLEFTETNEGTVRALFSCDSRFEGYSGYVHGGIVSSLLDGAMTNCMFARGHTPLTAELNVRFRHPVVIGEPATVRAWVDRHTHRLHLLRAEITQQNLVKARAWGKFLKNVDI